MTRKSTRKKHRSPRRTHRDELNLSDYQCLLIAASCTVTGELPGGGLVELPRDMARKHLTEILAACIAATTDRDRTQHKLASSSPAGQPTWNGLSGLVSEHLDVELFSGVLQSFVPDG